MALFEIYSHPFFKRYKTTLFSKAVFFQIAVFFLTFIPPLFVVYRSYGFWIRENYYRELPDVRFKHDLIVSLQYNTASRDAQGAHGGSTARFLTWSTYQNYNQLFRSESQAFSVPFIKSREVDDNGDGKHDRLELTLEMNVPDHSDVHSVQLLLIFEYKLYKFVTLTMESLAFIQYSSGVAGAGLRTLGDLRFKQREPLAHRGTDKRYDHPVIPESSMYAENFQIYNIIKNYTTRNVSTIYSNEYYMWETARGAGQPFVITAEISYPEDVYLYAPGFWFLIKWGWVQYVSVLAIFIFLFLKIKRFVFMNQIVPTVVEHTADHLKLS